MFAYAVPARIARRISANEPASSPTTTAAARMYQRRFRTILPPLLSDAPGASIYGICGAVDLRRDRFGQMLLEQVLDLRHVRAAVDAADDPLVDHEHEGGH